MCELTSSSVTVNWISLGFGQDETFKDAILGFGNHWPTFSNISWYFIDQTTNWSIIDEMIDRLFTLHFLEYDWITKHVMEVFQIQHLHLPADTTTLCCSPAIWTLFDWQLCKELTCLRLFGPLATDSSIHHTVLLLNQKYTLSEKDQDDWLISKQSRQS